MTIQTVFDLQIFRYEENQEIRTAEIDGEVWFYTVDICKVLGISNPSQAISKLDGDEKTTLINSEGRAGDGAQEFGVVNESGLYHLIFKSRKENAKKFRRWVTTEVLPSIRKRGGYLLPGVSATPVFVRRFNDNWDRVDKGYFSIINELFIRVMGRLEQVGYKMPDKGNKGREMRPDVSVGKLFPKWLEKHYPEYKEKFSYYNHIFPDGTEVQARQYENELLPIFIEYVESTWIPERALPYFKERDIKALPFLPKMLPDANKNKKQKIFDSALDKAIPVEEPPSKKLN